MPYILYYVYMDKLPEPGERISIYVFNQKQPAIEGRRLVGAATNDLGLEQFFGDAFWGWGKQGLACLTKTNIDLDLKIHLEEILNKAEDKRSASPGRIFLEKRKPRKGNYVYCIPKLVPDWVDARCVSPSEVLEGKIGLSL